MTPVFDRVRGPASTLVALVLISCGPSECVSGPGCETDGVPIPSGVTLSPVAIDLSAVGASEQVTATVADQNGQVMSSVTPGWTTSNASAATVTAGLVTAVGNGTATITASVGPLSASVVATVLQAVAEVTVTPDVLLIDRLGETRALTAVALDQGGTEISGQAFTWSSDAEDVATVDATGTVTAVTEGSADITAETTDGSQSFAATATVTVDEPLAIGTSDLPAGVETVPYGPVQLLATGGSTYTWAVAAGSAPLPDGLEVSTSGEITGTPTTAGTYPFSARVMSDGEEVEATLSITIEAVPVLVHGDASLSLFVPVGTGAAVERVLDVSNGGGSTLEWALGSDQSWLTLSPSSGATETSDPVTVTVDPGGLGAGRYTAVITGTAAVPAAGSPQTTAVDLTVAPLLGYSTEFPAASSHSADFLVGSALVVTTPTTLTHLAVIGKSTGPNVQLALYDDLDGSPNALLASTGSEALVVGAYEIEVVPVALDAGVYWFMAVYDGGANIGIDYATGTSIVKYTPLTFGTPLPSVFPTPLTLTGQEFNYYIRVSDPQTSSGPVGGPARVRAPLR